MFRVDLLSVRQRAQWIGTMAAGVIAVYIGGMPGAVFAQDWDDPVDPNAGRYDRPASRAHYDEARSYGQVAYADHVGWGARLGLGLVADPSLFLVDIAMPYNTGAGVSIGPRLQLGLSDDRTYLAPTLSLEYAHDLRSQLAGPFGQLRPLVQAGIGFAWLEKEKRRGDNDDVDFLFDIGVGFEYPLTDGFAVATVFDFNILPREALDEPLIFTWQVLQMRVQF